MVETLRTAKMSGNVPMALQSDQLPMSEAHVENGTSVPERTLLDEGTLPAAALARIALREGQATRPIYRMHRWFARRLGSQFRAILSGLTLSAEATEDDFWGSYLGKVSLDGLRVLDPFVGGGTTLIEARRAGASVIGVDIDPVAAFISACELRAPTADQVQQVLDVLLPQGVNEIGPWHLTNVGDGQHRVIHHFWVQVVECSSCAQPIELHPHYQLAYDRGKGLQWVFCRYCHEVHEVGIERKRISCKQCGGRTVIQDAPLSWNTATCRHCRRQQPLVPRGTFRVRAPEWTLFAQEYLDDRNRIFKKAGESDIRRYRKASERLVEHEHTHGRFRPSRPIPSEGRLDNRPLIHGIRRYDQLFNDRQLLHLAWLARRVAHIEDPSVRTLFSLAFSEHLTTVNMYTGYAFGYRRTSPLFSIHGYRHVTRPVELNPWLDGIGRGTFPNAVNKIIRALRYAEDPWDPAPRELVPSGKQPSSQTLQSANVSTSPHDVLSGSAKAAVLTQSSTDLSEVPDNSIDLVLTDPPYFDNVNYSELSDFYLAWHQVLGIVPPPYNSATASAPLVENLAVSDRTEEGVRRFTTELSRALSEANRVLHPDGRCVFTFHHGDAQAWLSLATALGRSGLALNAVLPLRGEGQGGLHSYDGTLRWDAVMVCQKGEPKPDLGDLAVRRRDLQKALAEVKKQAERLADPAIGFDQGEQATLLRAWILRFARPACSEGEVGIPLAEALGEFTASALKREEGQSA